MGQHSVWVIFVVGVASDTFICLFMYLLLFIFLGSICLLLLSFSYFFFLYNPSYVFSLSRNNNSDIHQHLLFSFVQWNLKWARRSNG